MAQITENDLKGILWEDISIQETAERQKILILICKDKEQGERLLDMLHKNAFSIKISIDKETKRYIIALLFSNSEYGIGCDTGKTEKQYPPLKWIKQNLITYITTGIWMGKTPEGNKISWFRKDFKSLESININ